MREKVVAELRPGERLLWCESPRPLKYFAEKHGFLGPVLFGAFLGGAFWATAADNGPGRFFLWICAALIFFSFAFEALSAFWTLYAITTMRLVILRPTLSATEITSYYAADLESLTKKRRHDGSGNLVFGAVREKSGKRTVTVPIGFFGIHEVDVVERAILDMRGLKEPNEFPRPASGVAD